MKRGLLWARLQVAVLALVGLLGLPAFSPDIGAGLDSSWVIAVSSATHRHLVFGRSFIFSYGPLGFLASPAFVVPSMGVVSVWVRIGFAVLLGWMIARSLLAVAPLWASAVFTVAGVWVLGGTFAFGAEAMLIPLLLLIGGLLDGLATRTSAISVLSATVLGALAGTMLLMKFDTGVWGLFFLLFAVVLNARAVRLGVSGSIQRLVSAVVGFVMAVLIWWGVLSQPIGALGSWLRGSVEVLIGYDRAMVANGGRWWELPAALFACAASGALSWLLTPVGRRSYVFLFLASASCLFTKQSFLRQDTGHVVRIFAMLGFALLVLLGVRSRSVNVPNTNSNTNPNPNTNPNTSCNTKKERGLGFRGRTLSVVMVAVVANLAMVVNLTASESLVSRLPDVQMVPTAFGWLIDPNQVVLNREGLLKNLNIGNTLRTELLKGSVHIEPSETSVVLGMAELRWNPLPVPQSYSAYTPWLDKKNATALTSPSGPEQVLYESGSIDGRVGRFESPTAMLNLICRYRVAYVDKRWTLFRRNAAGNVRTETGTPASANDMEPINACEGASFELKPLIGKFGQRVDLDIEGLDDYLIVGRFDGFEVTNQTRLQELATRPAQFWFRIGDSRTGTTGRFVPATAGAPHILSVPTCLRRKLGTFDSGLFTNFAVFDAPPKSKRATSKDRAMYRVRLEALPFSCPVG